MTVPQEPWSELDPTSSERVWAEFEEFFGFQAGVRAESWPAIQEPASSVTLDLSGLGDGARRAAGIYALNAEVLRVFTWLMPAELLVLDWQHPSYRFSPARQALAGTPWPVSVYPDGDYHAFVTEDFSAGTFGHPWEQTLCVFGAGLIGSLGAALLTWLPMVRVGGAPV